jgi:hypothetical protein
VLWAFHERMSSEKVKLWDVSNIAALVETTEVKIDRKRGPYKKLEQHISN